jgi:hypothetical protein
LNANQMGETLQKCATTAAKHPIAQLSSTPSIAAMHEGGCGEAVLWVACAVGGSHDPLRAGTLY